MLFSRKVRARLSALENEVRELKRDLTALSDDSQYFSGDRSSRLFVPPRLQAQHDAGKSLIATPAVKSLELQASSDAP